MLLPGMRSSTGARLVVLVPQATKLNSTHVETNDKPNHLF
jgi:hypothetical protein